MTLRSLPLAWPLLFLGGFLYAVAVPSGFGVISPLITILAGVLLVGTLGLLRPPEGAPAWGWAGRDPRPRLRSRLGRMLIYIVPMVTVGLYWIPATLEAFGAIPLWAGIPATAIFALLSYPQMYVLLLLDQWLWPRLPARLRRSRMLPALLMVIAEQISPQVFPAFLGHTWLAVAPRLFWAPLIGAAGYSLFTWLLVFTLVDLVPTADAPLAGRLRRNALPLALGGGFVLLSLFGPRPWTRTEDPELLLPVRLVQPSMPDYNEVIAERGRRPGRQYIVDTLRDMSLDPGEAQRFDVGAQEGQQPALVVWPEGASPVSLAIDDPERMERRLPGSFRRVARELNAELILGALDRMPETPENPRDRFEDMRNTAFLLGRDGEARAAYHKRVLIPGGETMPLGPLNPKLAEAGLRFFARGEGPQLIRLAQRPNGLEPIMSTLICYEVLFSELARRSLWEERDGETWQSQLIVNITYDGWAFGPAEPWLHLQLARWRPLELGLPLVRAVSQGPSGVLWPDGTQTVVAERWEPVVLELAVPLDGRPSPYARLGPLVWLLTGLLVVGVELAAGALGGDLQRR